MHPRRPRSHPGDALPPRDGSSPRDDFSPLRRRLLFTLPLFILAGCDAAPGRKTGALLHRAQEFNDWIQARVFDSRTLAPEYADHELTPQSGFRLNSYDTDTPAVDAASWKLEVKGMVRNPGAFSARDLAALPKKVMNTRHCCVEGWSIIVRWGGVPLASVLDAAGADSRARYVAVRCGDDYYTAYDMPSARHPQTLLAYEAYDQPLTLEHGAPARIVMPTKLGYKSAKWVNALVVTDEKPGGYWEDQGYDWFAGI